MVSGLNPSLIYVYFLKPADPSGPSSTGLLSGPRIKTKKVKQLLVPMLPSCGTSFLNTWGQLKQSAHLNEGWKHYCLLWLVHNFLTCTCFFFYNYLLNVIYFYAHIKHFEWPCAWMVLYKWTCLALFLDVMTFFPSKNEISCIHFSIPVLIPGLIQSCKIWNTLKYVIWEEIKSS